MMMAHVTNKTKSWISDFCFCQIMCSQIFHNDWCGDDYDEAYFTVHMCTSLYKLVSVNPEMLENIRKGSKGDIGLTLIHLYMLLSKISCFTDKQK